MVERDSIGFSRAATVWGGGSLIAATVLFSAVFVYLARAFGYPDVLDLPAAEVLPKLLALGAEGRAVWVLYGLIPLLLLPTGLGVHAVGRAATPLAARAALLMAALSALSMMVGLLRWPSLHWQLAQAYVEASPSAQAAISAVFAGANSFLGNFIGEFLGELFLNLFFALSTWAMACSAGGGRRWLLIAGLSASVIGLVAMLRNAFPALAPVAGINNVVLPVWMLAMGMAMLRQRRSS